MHCPEHLIIFTRFPLAGQAKTRLIPHLGAAGAADLQRRMTEHTIAQARELASRQPLNTEVLFTSGNRGQMAGWLGPELRYRAQGSGDLGQRQARAFDRAFQAGAERVIVIGADCPDLTADLLQLAFRWLKETDLVLGPARDGGYYLIGLRMPAPALLAEIPWSTKAVLATVLTKAARLEIPFRLLKPLHDIDRPADLGHWHPFTKAE
ncbi:MAG: glycosyltransferase [Desulfobacteraceae bacterium]|nr:MAG: glycosyltransferase [Desulfobacteraceae bacterium]